MTSRLALCWLLLISVGLAAQPSAQPAPDQPATSERDNGGELEPPAAPLPDPSSAPYQPDEAISEDNPIALPSDI